MNSEILLSFLITLPTWVMLAPIGLCSVLLLAVVIERTVYYNVSASLLRGTVREAIAHINNNKQKTALALLKKQSNSITRVFINFVESDDVSTRNSMVDEAAHHAVSSIERYSGLISTIATISPMFGLLGTVTGMMKSFSALSAVSAEAQNMLAYGIAEALVTTATGLLVGIPSVIFYNYMVSRSGSLIKQLEIALNSLDAEAEK